MARLRPTPRYALVVARRIAVNTPLSTMALLVTACQKGHRASAALPQRLTCTAITGKRPEFPVQRTRRQVECQQYTYLRAMLLANVCRSCGDSEGG